MAAARVTTASKATRVMALRPTVTLQVTTMPKTTAVRRATILQGLRVGTRRRLYVLPARCGSTDIAASTDIARSLPIAALTGSGLNIMADASSPGTGVAPGASTVFADSAAVRASPDTMTFVAGGPAGELLPGAISGAEQFADRASRETIVSAAERKTRDPSTVGRASAVPRRA